MTTRPNPTSLSIERPARTAQWDALWRLLLSPNARVFPPSDEGHKEAAEDESAAGEGGR